MKTNPCWLRSMLFKFSRASVSPGGLVRMYCCVPLSEFEATALVQGPRIYIPTSFSLVCYHCSGTFTLETTGWLPKQPPLHCSGFQASLAPFQVSMLWLTESTLQFFVEGEARARRGASNLVRVPLPVRAMKLGSSRCSHKFNFTSPFSCLDLLLSPSHGSHPRPSHFCPCMSCPECSFAW